LPEDEQVLEWIVSQVLQRMQNRVLLILTPGSGYQKEIYQRLRQYPQLQFSIVIAEDAKEQYQDWGQLGQFVTPDIAALPGWLRTYHCILVPFMDFNILGEVANGLFSRDSVNLINHALLLKIKVLALDYYCNPDSELNQLRGMASDAPYKRQIQQHLSQLKAAGMLIGDINKVLAELLAATQSRGTHHKSSLCNGYTTLSEVLKQPGYQISENEKLTDLAIDYIKAKK